MTGRVIIITGANSGIGYEAARILCEAGNDVILACRSEEKGKAAVEKVLKDFPNSLATFMQLDLADLSSVRKFVEDFHATGKRLSVLVNNAGWFPSEQGWTKHNFETAMGTNHLGHFLLTNLLLDDLKKTAVEVGEARVVIVTSSLHDAEDMGNKRMSKGKGVGPLECDNLFLDKPGTYNNQLAYKNSKAANVLFTYELARRLDGSNVTVNTVCPGFIPETNLARGASTMTRIMIRYLLKPIFKLKGITRTMEQGAKAIVDLAVSEERKGVSGKYFTDFQEKESSAESHNEDLQRELWELSARYCHLEGYEPLDAPPPEVVTKEEKKEVTEEKEQKGEEKKKEKGQGSEDRDQSSESKEKIQEEDQTSAEKVVAERNDKKEEESKEEGNQSPVKQVEKVASGEVITEAKEEVKAEG